MIRRLLILRFFVLRGRREIFIGWFATLYPFFILTFVLRTGVLSTWKVPKDAGARPGPQFLGFACRVAGDPKPFAASYRHTTSSL